MTDDPAHRGLMAWTRGHGQGDWCRVHGVIDPHTSVRRHILDQHPDIDYEQHLARAIANVADTEDRDRLAADLRESYDADSNDANPKRGWCECGMAINAHGGGFVLLMHDFFIVDRLADRLFDLGWRKLKPRQPPMTDEEYAAAIAAMLCPACDAGEHWNHREADGSCRTVDRVHDHHCPCPFRP